MELEDEKMIDPVIEKHAPLGEETYTNLELEDEKMFEKQVLLDEEISRGLEFEENPRDLSSGMLYSNENLEENDTCIIS